MRFIHRYFDLAGRGSTLGREVRGGLATFLTMAYILIVNPIILKDAWPAGEAPMAALMSCTALAAAICCLLMGLVANFPLALASGLGLNAIVAVTVTAAAVDAGLTTPAEAWKVAMGVIVLDGLVILLLVLTGLREAIMHAIPRDLRLAIGAGIGLFIAFIGLKNAQLVIPGGALLTFGTLRNPVAATGLIGLLITACLVARRVRGALLIGIAVTTAIAFAFGIAHVPETLPAPRFDVAFQADVLTALSPVLLPLLFAILMVDFFDTLGTATGVAEAAGLVDDRGHIPGVRRILIVDSISAAIGGVLGVSSNTSYVESAAGVAEGARTGLHSVVVGLLFAASIFLAPLAVMVPDAATAPALILVGFLMLVQIVRVDFHDLEGAIPAFITLLTIPLTFSIAHGIGYGFLAFVIIKLAGLKWREVHPLMFVVTAAFLTYFIWGKT